MSKIAYVPFTDGGLAGYVEITVGRFNQGRIFDRFSKPVKQYPSSLASVSSRTQLYVYGHGGGRSDDIQDNNGNSLTLDELASRIKAAGLATNHKVIKLFACSGGCGGGQSMAAKFHRALRGKGYAKVVVYGYGEDLSVDSGVSGRKTGVSGARAKSIRSKFG